MALKTFKPYTKSTRGTILLNKSGLWKGKPFKSLVTPKNSMKGRNNNGHITSRNRAGGHKKMYRQVDFYRKKIVMHCVGSPTLLVQKNENSPLGVDVANKLSIWDYSTNGQKGVENILKIIYEDLFK